MMTVLCPNCKHSAGTIQYHGKAVFLCLAFPTGIPQEILTGEVDHRKPYSGDRGIQFEPLDPEAWENPGVITR